MTIDTKYLADLVEKGTEAQVEWRKTIEERFDALEAKGNRPGFGSPTANGSQNEWKQAFTDLQQKDFNHKFEISQKALTSDASFVVPGVMQPLAVTANTYSVFLADYIPQRMVDGPSVVVNTIGTTTLAGIQAAQGDAKTQISPTTVSKTLTLQTVANYIKVSTQAMQDVADLQSVVNGILQLRLKAKIDAMLYAAASTTGNFTAFTSVAGKPGIDNITNALAQLATYGLQGTVFLNPTDYATLVLTKASTAGIFLGLPNYEGITIKQASVVPANKFLISTLDGIGLGLATRSAAMIAIGTDASDFTTNQLTVLAEQRVVPFVTDPSRVIIGSLVV